MHNQRQRIHGWDVEDVDSIQNNSHLNCNITHHCRLIEVIAISSLVTIIWFLVVFGNALVILAIVKDRRLKGVQHWYLASLAFADLFLGLFVLPFSLVKEILGYWIFGQLLCSLWLAIDVLLCTASIMNLCLISLDRYWSITQPLVYPRMRTPRRAGFSIALVWIISAVICLPPLLGWNKPQTTSTLCELTNDLGYVLYSSIGSFYIPLAIIIVVYAKVFWEARRRLRKRPGDSDLTMSSVQSSKIRNKRCGKPKVAQHNFYEEKKTRLEEPEHNIEPVIELFSNDREQQLNEDTLNGQCKECETNNQCGTDASNSQNSSFEDCARQESVFRRLRRTIKHKPWHRTTSSASFAEQKKRLAKQRERRATIVLGIILGAFIICWFPFFTFYIINILCNCINKLFFEICFWLGYCNSALNPIIYTVFNKDFRKAFKQLLTRRKTTYRYKS